MDGGAGLKNDLTEIVDLQGPILTDTIRWSVWSVKIFDGERTFE